MKVNEELYLDGVISQQQNSDIESYERNRPFSIHWELKVILYLGVLLFTSGISLLVYKNIDAIGHQFLLGFIALVCGGCFYYIFKNRPPYSSGLVKSELPFFDYIVLLACLLLGIFIGYIQYQYRIFGVNHGVAVIIPTLVYFFCAYIFDNRAILNLGISGLATWVGITVKPLEIFNKNDFSDSSILISSIALGMLLLLFSKVAYKWNFKKHFSFSYNNFAAHLLLIATLNALFEHPLKFLSVPFLGLIVYYYFTYAVSNQSFYFLLLSMVYGYIGFTYLFIRSLFYFKDVDLTAVYMLYFTVSCIAVVKFLMGYKKILSRTL